MKLMKTKLFLIIFLSSGIISCSSLKIEKMLDELDDLVEDRLEVYASHEADIQSMKDSLAVAVSHDEKWSWAEKLYQSYEDYSLDSALAYVEVQKLYASTRKQQLLTSMYELVLLAYRHNEIASENIFLSLDTLDIREVGLLQEYYASGMALYSYMMIYSKHHPSDKSGEKMTAYRNLLLSVDSVSFQARNAYSKSLRDKGDYKAALAVLDNLEKVETDTHNQALIAYNQAEIYGRMGDRGKRKETLVKSVRNDISSSARNYLSLYNLALMLYEENSLKRASKYISANMTDAIAGGFNTRMINAGMLQMIIADATRQEEKEMNAILFFSMSCFFLLFILVCALLVKNVRHSRRLKRIQKVLIDTNSKLEAANSDLKLANRIKDSYVFSYMELSINYLGKLEASRKEIRSIAKNEGLEAVMKYLRSPSDIYEAYKHYYKVFDEAFLGIFPDFREKVNELLKEESRFPISDEPVLCTELRLLAAIRLGIVESGKIATFLNCAPTTVYTYRTRFKRAAVCPKDQFEILIGSI